MGRVNGKEIHAGSLGCESVIPGMVTINVQFYPHDLMTFWCGLQALWLCGEPQGLLSSPGPAMKTYSQ